MTLVVTVESLHTGVSVEREPNTEIIIHDDINDYDIDLVKVTMKVTRDDISGVQFGWLTEDPYGRKIAGVNSFAVASTYEEVELRLNRAQLSGQYDSTTLIIEFDEWSETTRWECVMCGWSASYEPDGGVCPDCGGLVTLV